MVSAEEEELLTALPGAILAADSRGRIVYANATSAELLGWEDPEHLVGRRITSMMPERMIALHEAGFQRYLREGRSRLLGKRVRVPVLRSDRLEEEMDVRIRMFRRPDGTDLIIAAFEAPAAAGQMDLTVVRLEQLLAERDYVVAR